MAIDLSMDSIARTLRMLLEPFLHHRGGLIQGANLEDIGIVPAFSQG